MFAVVDLLSSVATGGSFTSATVIVNVEVFELFVPSLTRHVKVSVPLKSGAGVYVRLAPDPVRSPWKGPVRIVYVSAPAGEAASSVIDFATSSFVLVD